MDTRADPAKDVGHRLYLLQRQLAEIERVCRLEAIEARVVRELGDPGRLLRGVLSLLRMRDEFELEKLQLAAAAEVPIGVLTPELQAFLERDYPRVDEHAGRAFQVLLSELWDKGEARVVLAALKELPPVEHPHQLRSESGGIRWIIATLVRDLIDDLERDGEEPAEHISMAAVMTQAEFFQPDAWWNNWRELQPVLAARQVGHFPRHVRLALREAHHSYIFGNGLAVVALSRSILEAALSERGKLLGVDTSDLGRGEPRRLRELAGDLGRLRPELRVDLDLIIDYGNDVMHPERKPPLHPNSVMNRARSSLDSLRRLLEKVYSTR